MGKFYASGKVRTGTRAVTIGDHVFVKLNAQLYFRTQINISHARLGWDGSFTNMVE